MCNLINCLEFYMHTNFFLHNDGWGEGLPQDIIKVLDSVITEFYTHLDTSQITKKVVYIINSKNKTPPIDHPQIIKHNKFNLIYLSTSDRYWSKYAYQFAHELCHHVVDSDFYTTNDKFGWFEEAICELASIFCIDKMSQTWQINPPYPNWGAYAPSLADYVKKIIGDPDNKPSKPFKSWLTDNLELLFKDRYKRKDNRIVALQLFPLFKHRPEIWKTIQYMKFINVVEDMTLDDFIDAWFELVPDKLKEHIIEIKTILCDEKSSNQH